MADIVLYHHAQGLTEGVRAFAGRLSDAGHTVHLPDLYDGRTFATLDEGIAHAKAIGFDALAERGVAAAGAYGDEVVYGGFSLGVLPAQQLAQTRPGAVGALLISACFPASEFGDAWPAGVPLQVHGMDADPEFAGSGDLDAARELVATVDDAELLVYPGSAHLFADSSLPDYDEEAAELLTTRVLEFLGRIG